MLHLMTMAKLLIHLVVVVIVKHKTFSIPKTNLKKKIFYKNFVYSFVFALPPYKPRNNKIKPVSLLKASLLKPLFRII